MSQTDAAFRVARRVALLVALVVLAGSPSLLAQGSACGPLDVVFVVDTTGSMGGAIDSVKTDLAALIQQINQVSGGDFRLGLVQFGDTIDVLDDIGAAGLEKVTADVNALFASGGAGESEASDEALNTVVNGLKASARPPDAQKGDFVGGFRASAAKVVILVTDARPAGFDDNYTPGVDDTNAHRVALTANTRDIRISAIFVPTAFSGDTGVQDTVIRIMKDYATVTGGKYIQANADGSGTGAAISEIVQSCGGATFFLSVEPLAATIGNDEGTQFLVTTTAVGRFSSELTLSAANLPDGATATFEPATIAAPGTGTSVMTIHSGATTFPGAYFITVNGTSADALVTRGATIKVTIECRAPFIFGLPDNQPQSQTVAPGQSATLKVVPGGSDPFSYQWYEGPSGSTERPVAGATQATFVTPPLTQSTDYWVRVRNACGSYDSFGATVTVASQAGTGSGLPGRSRATRRGH